MEEKYKIGEYIQYESTMTVVLQNRRCLDCDNTGIMRMQHDRWGEQKPVCKCGSFNTMTNEEYKKYIRTKKLNRILNK